MIQYQMRWSASPAIQASELYRRAKELPLALASGMEAIEVEADNMMKSGAPWTDRSGEARDMLVVRLFVEGTSVTLEMASESDHADFLEFGTRFMSAYPIVLPTLNTMIPRTYTLMQQIAG